MQNGKKQWEGSNMPKPSSLTTPALALVVGVLALALAGCFGSEKEERGLRYMPDMYESPAF